MGRKKVRTVIVKTGIGRSVVGRGNISKTRILRKEMRQKIHQVNTNNSIRKEF